MLIRIMELTATQFISDSPLLLPAGEVQLWPVSIQDFACGSKELAMLLSAEETGRMKQFRFPQDRLRFLVAHGLLRRMIGQYLNIASGRILLESGSKGKPELYGKHGQELFAFNISHSHNLVVLAFARAHKLGVDVEHIRCMPDFPEIVACFFHPQEKAAFQRHPYGARQQAFFDCWTCKEAFVKATGEGLNRSLDSFCITSNSENNNTRLNVTGEGISTASWNIAPFRPAPGYAGAVAFEV
ncbi:4'-phosphopantetheinyl transferase family protein [Sporomusa termitida]|uniref:4'-phosphopantetheinyl transferase Sfp n=1 Tax=Sporomusa termitida TaxID=2377 RepID=A0A517DRH2_9FIRM|nr:4'-phosphopantetheinyl transferase superfamily protein [Sporomusa termitida]QDR79917.1 4'-phosphopantetheinyl transferase Sfp [Sporomusa termitida]